MTYQTDIQDANAYLQQGNYKRCLKAALSAAKKSPTSPLAPNIAGIAASAAGKPLEAIRHFQRALKLKPDFTDAQRNLGQTLLLAGRADGALAVLSKLCKSTPQDWKAWYLRAQAELAAGQTDAALASADQALTLPGVTGTVHHLRSNINLSRGYIKDAIVDLQNALQLDPQDVTALLNLSLPLARQTRSDEALDVITKAVALEPENPHAQFRLATQLVEMGRPQEGIEAYRAVLGIDPAHAAALERLVEVLPPQEAAALKPAIRAALKTAAKNSEDRASLMFALATALGARDATEEAQKALAQANREMAGLNPYDARADKAFMDGIIARFPTALAQVAAPQAPYRPIFVLGLPRSGTTLVEAMLGAHPHIAPLGERGTIGFLLKDIFEQDLPFTAQDAAALVQHDQRLLPDLPEGTRAFVDKMPENYRLVGFLKAAYPDCRIINLRRDPRDIALSMWKAHFSGSLLSYTYDFRWMAEKFNLYAAAMAHWRQVFGDQILDLRYEELVADVDAASRRLAQFCDVAWDPGMARPDLSADQVLTLSATQLRQPVHSGSVGKWRARAALLEPFIDGLEKTLWTEDLD